MQECKPADPNKDCRLPADPADPPPRNCRTRPQGRNPPSQKLQTPNAPTHAVNLPTSAEVGIKRWTLTATCKLLQVPQNCCPPPQHCKPADPNKDCRPSALQGPTAKLQGPTSPQPPSQNHNPPPHHRKARGKPAELRHRIADHHRNLQTSTLKPLTFTTRMQTSRSQQRL